MKNCSISKKLILEEKLDITHVYILYKNWLVAMYKNITVMTIYLNTMHKNAVTTSVMFSSTEVSLFDMFCLYWRILNFHINCFLFLKGTSLLYCISISTYSVKWRRMLMGQNKWKWCGQNLKTVRPLCVMWEWSPSLVSSIQTCSTLELFNWLLANKKENCNIFFCRLCGGCVSDIPCCPGKRPA